jgi:hypothetical protein
MNAEAEPPPLSDASNLVQLLRTDLLEADQPPEKPRRRGAPPGNQNALKHGFYSARFNKSELKDYNSADFTGLAQEIALLRLYIRRVVDLGVTSNGLSLSIDLLRALSLAVTSLTRLLKAQSLLSNIDADITQSILEVYEELNGSTPSASGLLSGRKSPPSEEVVDDP